MKPLKVFVALAVVLGLHAFVQRDWLGMSSATATVGDAQIPCPLRGSCNLEPGLLGRTDLLLFEDFEASDWQAHWTGFGHANNLGNPTSPVYSGSRSGEVRVPSGMHDGASLDFDFTTAGVADPEEIYFRYYVRFNDSWQRNGDGEIGKFPGFGGSYGSGAGHGCSAVNGTNGWTARMMNFDRGSLHQVGFYTYHADMAGPCGEHMPWPPLLERNRWYSIEARVRLNTITDGRGNHDGILQGWIDDELVFTRTNLRFRDVPNLKIEKIWGNLYVGGTWVADRNMEIHFDNMVIARNRIGANVAKVPLPPTNLQIAE